jgi:hypothetical protein
MSTVRSIPWLESVDARLDRAKEHLDIVKGRLRDFIKSTKHNLVLKKYPQPNGVCVVWWADEPSHPPMSVSIEIGEFLYNLRSALDNLVCALVRREQGTYGASCSGNGFPIHTNCDLFDREVPVALKGVPPSARTLIYGLQPYMRGAGTADLDPLNILNQLRNRDTHRALHLGLAYHRNTQITISDIQTGRVIAQVALPETIYLSSGPQTIPLPITADDVRGEVNVKAGSTTGVRFREDGPWSDQPVDHILVTCFEYVEKRVIARFKPFFN